MNKIFIYVILTLHLNSCAFKSGLTQTSKPKTFSEESATWDGNELKLKIQNQSTATLTVFPSKKGKFQQIRLIDPKKEERVFLPIRNIKGKDVLSSPISFAQETVRSKEILEVNVRKGKYFDSSGKDLLDVDLSGVRLKAMLVSQEGEKKANMQWMFFDIEVLTLKISS